MVNSTCFQNSASELEKLVKQSEKILYSWRLKFRPGSFFQSLNLDRKISKLNSQLPTPPFNDWVFAFGFETARIFAYYSVLNVGSYLYRAYTGN